MAQKKETFVGKWKVDYEASKAFMSESEKKDFTEEIESKIKPMIIDLGYNFMKDGKFTFTLKGEPMGKEATWSVKGKELTLMMGSARVFEIKEATKTKLVLYDKNENGGFKTLVWVPNN